MTQIFSFVSGPLVQVASDRLVSVKSGATIRPWDTDANKVIIFIAADAVVALGYTGIAYIGEQPTDVFLASQLAERDLSHLSDMAAPRDSKRAQELGHTVVRLMRALESAPINPSHIGLAPTILIAGFRWRNRTTVQRTHRGAFRWAIHRHPDGRYAFRRLQHVPGQIHVDGVPVTQLTESEVEPYFDAIEALDASRPVDELVEASEQSAALLVRAVSDRVTTAGMSTVGRDVTVISIPSPLRGRRIHARLIPDPNRDMSLQATQTPWVVAPNLIVPPAEVIPGRTVAVPPFEVVFEGPLGSLAPGEVGLSLRGLARKPRPR